MPLTKKRLSNPEKKKAPSAKKDYIPYQNVLPSPRTLNEYKQLLAIQAEADAANALFNIPPGMQIVRLICETYERLALLVNTGNERKATAKELWEKTTALMTWRRISTLERVLLLR